MTTETVKPEVGTAVERIDPGEGWRQQDASRDMVAEFVSNGNDRFALAKTIAGGGLTHHKTPEAVMTVMLAAFEMGIPLMQALRGMYVVQGKLALEGHLMDGLAITRCGVTKRIVERSRTRCEIVFSRPGWEDVSSTYDLTDAELAGIIRNVKDDGSFQAIDKRGKPKDNWKGHPREMLYWRALSAGLKIIAPDFFGGLYHVDELRHVVEETRPATEARKDLKALMEGVEPDELAMDEDEIDQLRGEVNDAKAKKLISPQKATAILDHAAKGNWRQAREAQEEVRSRLLEAMAADEAGQGELL